MLMVEYCFIFVAILGKKVYIFFFLWWVDGDNSYWQLSTVCCSKFPAVTQHVWKGGLRKSDGWSGKPDGWSRSMREMPRGMREIPMSMREMARRVKDARRMADGCSVVHPYYYRNHDTWPQIYGKTTESYGWSGKLSRMCYNHLDSLYGCCTYHVKIFSHAGSWRRF